MLGSIMEREILEQPEVFARGVQDYASALPQFDRPELIVLVARGSSDHAALYARYLFEITLGIPVTLAAPSVMTKFGAGIMYPKCLAIGISQSGEAPDVSEVLSSIRDQGHETLAITNTADSRITQAANHTLLLGCGLERSVAATKTYTASLLALYELARKLRAGLPAPRVPDTTWIEEMRGAAEQASGAIVRSQIQFSLARGYRFASAHETALKLMECALLPCKAYSLADFEHGPKALAGHGSAVILYGAGGGGLREQGADLIHAPEAPVTEPEAPLWEIAFGQWLALHAARARGLDPDTPVRLQKVTKTL
jgi:glucosamine--fructose-6-phosphate aminotransferase (isomerizing)